MRDEAARTFTVTLSTPVHEALREELFRQVYFIDERIAEFSLLTCDEMVYGVRLTTAGPVPPADLARKIESVVAGNVLSQLPPRRMVRWTSARSPADVVPAADELRARGLAFATGEGQMAVAQPVIGLMTRLDELLCGIATEGFGAVEYRYPTLLPTTALYRSGYLSSFPHHAMFTTRLHADLDSYRDFVDNLDGVENLRRSIMERCADADYCLPPTMCYHTFHQFSGRELTAPTATVTARGKSFRFESRYEAGLERLWDFTIREIVFAGPREYTIECRDRLLERATSLFDELRLAGSCELANDPFFGQDRAGHNVSAQRMLELKYEARLAVAPGRTIAAGSFNVHDKLFGDAFRIRLPGGGTAFTSCAGFGLERLAYAVLCQHGVDEEGWPPLLRGTGRRGGRR